MTVIRFPTMMVQLTFMEISLFSNARPLILVRTVKIPVGKQKLKLGVGSIATLKFLNRKMEMIV